MSNNQNAVRNIAREHLDAIEAAIVQVNMRLSMTKAKFERSFRESADASDPSRIGLELEQAAFELERDRLRAIREAAKTQYLRTFNADEDGDKP